MLKKLLILWFLPATLFASEKMTVEQAVAAALQNNANVRNAGLEVEKGEAQLRAQKTRRYPAFNVDAFGSESLTHLSLTFDKGSLGTFPSTGPIPDKDTRIDLARTFNTFVIARVSQPLTQLYKINLGVQLGEAALAADKEQQRAARQAIAREVKRAYFNALTAGSYAAAAQEAVTTYEEVARETSERVSQKTALEADRLDAEARLASAKATALSASNALATAKDQLAYLVGQDIDVVPIESGNRQLATGNVDQRPDVRAAELQLQQAKLDAKIKRADRIPDVSLTVSRTTPLNIDVLPQNLTSAALTVSYEPFTWGRRSAELAQKLHTAEQAENVVRDRRAAAAVEIAAQRRRVEEAEAQAIVRRLEVDAARERLRVTKTKFHEQAARSDEMYGASAALTQAVAREQDAISAYWTARADYDKAIGEE